jgi:hypothetical protein
MARTNLNKSEWLVKNTTAASKYRVQGISSGFEIMFLALADRNTQVRFGLKVVWES